MVKNFPLGALDASTDYITRDVRPRFASMLYDAGYEKPGENERKIGAAQARQVLRHQNPPQIQ